MRQSQLSIPDYGALLSERGAHCVYLQWQLAGGSGGNRSVTVPGLSASLHLLRHSTFGWADSSTPRLRLYSLFFRLLSSFSLLWSPLGALRVLLEELSFAAVDLCPQTCVGWGQLALLGICWLAVPHLVMSTCTLTRVVEQVCQNLPSCSGLPITAFPPAYRFPNVPLCRSPHSLWWFHHASSRASKAKGSGMNHG